MQIIIPAVKMIEVEGKPKYEEYEISVEIDTSYAAHLKWEEQFQAGYSDGRDLETHIKILTKYPDMSKHATEALKALYCCIDSSKLPTFKEFVKILHVQNVARVLDKIKVVLEEVGKSTSKN